MHIATIVILIRNKLGIKIIKNSKTVLSVLIYRMHAIARDQQKEKN